MCVCVCVWVSSCVGMCVHGVSLCVGMCVHVCLHVLHCGCNVTLILHALIDSCGRSFTRATRS